MATMQLTLEEVRARRDAVKLPNQVMFRVAALYGLSAGMRMPLNESEAIHSGQCCVTIDPDADPRTNLGIIDYEQCRLTVSYGAQIVFPGLYDLITQQKHDPSLLNPVRATATDDCTLTNDLRGWHALGCLEFLAGSIWSGATGG